MNEMLMNTVEEAESGLRKPGRSGWNEADSYIYTIAKTEEGKSAKGKAASVAKEERKIVPLFFATDDQLSALSCRDDRIVEGKCFKGFSL